MSSELSIQALCAVLPVVLLEADPTTNPRPGDGKFCLNCGQPSRFTDRLELRPMCPQELQLFLAHDAAFSVMWRFLQPLRPSASDDAARAPTQNVQ